MYIADGSSALFRIAESPDRSPCTQRPALIHIPVGVDHLAMHAARLAHRQLVELFEDQVSVLLTLHL